MVNNNATLQVHRFNRKFDLKKSALRCFNLVVFLCGKFSHKIDALLFIVLLFYIFTLVIESIEATPDGFFVSLLFQESLIKI